MHTAQGRFTEQTTLRIVLHWCHCRKITIHNTTTSVTNHQTSVTMNALEHLDTHRGSNSKPLSPPARQLTPAVASVYIKQAVSQAGNTLVGSEIEFWAFRHPTFIHLCLLCFSLWEDQSFSQHNHYQDNASSTRAALIVPCNQVTVSLVLVSLFGLLVVLRSCWRNKITLGYLPPQRARSALTEQWTVEWW